MERKVVNSGKLTRHFIIGFLIYQLIGGLVADIIVTPIEMFFKNQIGFFQTNKLLILSLFMGVLSIFVMNFVATFITTKSLFKSFKIDSKDVSKFIKNILIFFIILSVVTSILKSIESLPVSIIGLLIGLFTKDINIKLSTTIILFVIHFITLLIMLSYVKKKTVKASDLELENHE